MAGQYTIIPMRGFGHGLNTLMPTDEVPAGQVVVCQNIDPSQRTIKKRPGTMPVLRGDGDTVLKGGPPGASLYVTGSQYYLEYPENQEANSGLSQKADFYHHRHAVAVIPEGNLSNLRLDVKDGAVGSYPNWAFDMTLWTDDFTGGPEDPTDTSGVLYEIAVVAKSQWVLGDQNRTQWAVMLIPVGADMTGRQQYNVALRVYESSFMDKTDTAYNAQDFMVSSKYFQPGLRHWVGWVFNQLTNQVTSYFWAEGDGSVTSSATAVNADLKTNGVAGSSYPIVIGRRPVPYDYTERGFNGVVGEMRFWWKANGNQPTTPTWNVNYAGLESEFTDSYLDAITDDLALYFSLRHEDVSNERFIDPRYSIQSDETENRAWLTGADCTWISGGGVNLIPGYASVGAQADSYYDAIANKDSGITRYIFGGGIRIPNSNRYMRKAQTRGGTTSQFAWPDQFTVRVRFEIDAFVTSPDSNTPDHTLFEVGALQGYPSGAENNYVVDKCLTISVVWDGANWVAQARISIGDDSFDAATILNSTTSISAATAYTLAVTAFYDNGAGTEDHVLKLFLDGVQEDTASAAGDRPDPAQAVNTDRSGNNQNSADGGNLVWPMSIGCSCESDIAIPIYFVAGTIHSDLGDLAGASWKHWSWHNNNTPRRTGDEGTLYRGGTALRGKIYGVDIWNRTLTEAEILQFVSSGPDPIQASKFGTSLLSSWNFNEGKGNVAYDRGFLQNHLQLNTYTRCRPIANCVHREAKSQILGIWEHRSRTPREGIGGREIYVYAGGSVLQLDHDADYLRPLSGGDQIVLSSPPLPTAFQSSDFLFLCTGTGPPLRISRDRVTMAGISPVVGQPQGGDQGWIEEDRDGTFQIGGETGTGLFPEDDDYIWWVTFYDPDTGLESVPSRPMKWKIESTGSCAAVTIDNLPHPRDRHASRMRIYRSQTNGGTPYFVDEIQIQPYYVDILADTSLGPACDSFNNYPPPINARIGVLFGSRALYAGVPNSPGTVYYSLQAYPEACPPEYQITIASGRSAEITGILVLHDRAILFQQDAAWVLYDIGGDISIYTVDQPPLQLAPLWQNVGCVNHHTIVHIQDVGVVFAGENGLYLTDGLSFRKISRRIDPTYESLDKSTYRQWFAVHWRRRHQYLLFCRDGTGGGVNNTVLVWQYDVGDPSDGEGPGGFCTYTMEARCGQVVEDNTTGENRLYLADYYGQIFEFDPYDVTLTSDHLLSSDAARGTVQSGSTTTAVKLVDDNSLPTDGDGLRGALLAVGDPDSSPEESRILSNTDDTVTLETALASSPAAGTIWQIGQIQADYQTGKIDFGRSGTFKLALWLELFFKANTAGRRLRTQIGWDDETAQDFTADPSERKKRLGEVTDRGQEIQIRLFDNEAANPWEVSKLELAIEEKERTGW